MMAAITAARLGADVCLVERNPKLGRKLYITGKGRCNVTNHCTPEEVLAATPRNGKFLYSAMNQTPPAEVERFFTELGVELKVEGGNRVFPVSDRSADIIDALFFELRRLSVPVIQGRVSALDVQDGAVCAVELRQDGEGQKKIPCRGVVLATGGASYPATGSTGDGYELARSAGHSVVPPRPSLVPLEAEEGFCGEMQGLALKNVALRMKDRKGKVLFQEQGELLFTHFGLSGPLILSASAHLRDFEKNSYRAVIDLKPALDEEKLEARKLTVVPSLPEGETYVYADGRHLWRVIDNLLGNCAKYAMEGTRIYLELVRGKGQVTLSIKNISRDPLNVPPERLMERFVRGDESRTTEGSGLGLSIARSLTELQGGTFELAVDGDLFKATVTMPQSG